MRRKWRVVVISQHIGLRTLASIVFKRGGHDVEAVPSRGEAMPIIAQGLPDLVILDLHLADESGLTLASDLRTLYPQLPIMLIPPHSQVAPVPEEEMQAAEQLGVKLLDKQTGIAGHNFNLEVHKLLNHA
jgi:DNA-binding NtrC family response regulator